MIKRAAEGKKVRMKTLIKSDMAANIFQSSDVGTHNRRTRGADWDSPGPARYLHTHTQDIYIYIYERSSSSTRPYLCGARTRGKCGRCAQDRRRGIGADYSRVRRSKDSIHNRCRRFYTEEGGYPSRVIDRDRTNVTYIHSTQAIIICRISSANRLVTADVYKRPAARPLAQQSPIVTLRPSRFTASRYSPRSISCSPLSSIRHPSDAATHLLRRNKTEKTFCTTGGRLCESGALHYRANVNKQQSISCCGQVCESKNTPGPVCGCKCYKLSSSSLFCMWGAALVYLNNCVEVFVSASIN